MYVETSLWKTIRTKDWKLNFCVRAPSQSQFFYMGKHPDELNNLWQYPSHSENRTRLMIQLFAWLGQTQQPATMDKTWEVHPGTSWFRWLANQPQQPVRSEDPAPNYESKGLSTV